MTAGIDFALILIKNLLGELNSQVAELVFEYRPEPPNGTGHPETAGEGLTAHVVGMCAPLSPGLDDFVAAGTR